MKFLKEVDVLEHGYVKLIGVYGDDDLIEYSARMSYDKSRKVSDSRNLIRYLMRNHHMSPFEMGEVHFELKMPLFIIQQLLRHRTANVNAMSLRYSEAIDDFFEPEEIYTQSTDNKQGAGNALEGDDYTYALDTMKDCHAFTYEKYKELLDMGISREDARSVLPTGNFSKLVWKSDIRNFFNFIRLRNHPHAQWEIREYAQVMYDMVFEYFPISFEAFDDYQMNSVSFSKTEMDFLINRLNIDQTFLEDLELNNGLGAREKKEFLSKILPE